ncbi:MAG: PAS domain S-box protein [Betaproteobacteria bacterium]|nr:PAS domain S-box protein [Betaproteobacteria bacterium]
MPNISLALFILAMLAVLWVLHRHELEQERNALMRDTQWAEQTINLHLKANQDFLEQLAREITSGVVDNEAFQIRATQHLANNPELTNVVWVGPDLVNLWAAPFETTGRIVGERVTAAESLSAFRRAMEHLRPAYSTPFTAASGEVNLEVHLPVAYGRVFSGTVVGVYSPEGMLRHLVPSWFAEKYRMSILNASGRPIAMTSAGAGGDEDVSYTISLDFPGQGLMLKASPFRTSSKLAQNMLVALIIGLSLLIVWSLWSLRNHMLRRVQVEKERDRLFNLSLDMLCIVGLDGRFRRVNPAFQRILGHPEQELLAKPVMEIIHPDDRDAGTTEMHKLAAGFPSISFESRCRCADGAYKWLVWTANPAVEEGAIYAVAHDISDRKRAEEALRTEYAFRKSMEDSMLTGMRAVDMEGRITYVNPAFCRMTGWSEQELVGCTPPMPYWAPEETESAQAAFRGTLAGEAPRTGYELRFRRRNGERFDAIIYVAPLIDARGQQTGWMASINDITERKRAREELRRSHERFVAVMDGLDAAVCVTDPASGELLYANGYFRSMFGADGRGKYALAASSMASAADYPVAEAVEDDSALLFDGEVLNACDDHWYYVRARAIRWVDGRTVRMEIATDITARMQAEEISRRQLEKLQLTSRLTTMGEMASTLAHELNQPLSAIANYSMGCVNRLLAGTASRDELLNAMQKASFQAQRAGKIIRRIREFVRKSEPNRTPCAINDIVEEAVGFAEIEAQKKGIRVVQELAPGLPEVCADRIMIEQVILNLVRNGIEAMDDTPEERRALTVRTTRGDDGAVEIAVSDAGHGIPSEQRDKLFSAFFTTKAEGMGMGLNICRSIVEFHKGRLWVEDNPAGGTVFRFTLPTEAAA